MATTQKARLEFGQSPTAKVHSLVIFNICNSYLRRPDQSTRVVGTLLGSFLPDGTVDIRNSYVVPDRPSLNTDHHYKMLMAHQQVYPGDDVVGWYATGAGVEDRHIASMHEFFSDGDSISPVHLLVDTEFVNEAGSIRAYVSKGMSLGGRRIGGIQYGEIPVDLFMADAEEIGMDHLKKTASENFPSDSEELEASMKRLQVLLDDVYRYVDGVVEGRVVGDVEVGKFISEAVNELPMISHPAFQKLMNDGVKEELLVMYLMSLTKTQLSLAGKLSTAAQDF